MIGKASPSLTMHFPVLSHVAPPNALPHGISKAFWILGLLKPQHYVVYSFCVALF